MKQEGFTIVELLITLFVAAAFLVAGYQLFTLVQRDSGQVRAQAIAGNVAYDYMRRYSTSLPNPCSGSSTPLNNSPLSVVGLSGATITINISCPYTAVSNLTRVEAVVSYNTTQTVRYATYVTQ